MMSIHEERLEEAKRTIVKQALQDLEKMGSRSTEQLLLTFRTQFPGVVLGEGLVAAYPEEMSIILKDVFWNLAVHDDFFSVDLLFNDQRQSLRVPYRALVNFMVPEKEFGLQFEWETAVAPRSRDNIIFLDQFRVPRS